MQNSARLPAQITLTHWKEKKKAILVKNIAHLEVIFYGYWKSLHLRCNPTTCENFQFETDRKLLVYGQCGLSSISLKIPDVHIS